MKTTVIHHSADYDGIFCREIARKFLPDAELIGWDFGDDKIPVPLDGAIYILDLSPECLDLPYGGMVPGISSRIIWIDHHKSSIEKWPSELSGYRIDGVAACRLAWQHFSVGPDFNKPDWKGYPTKQDFLDRKVSEPESVMLVGEYDIWDHAKSNNADVAFQFGLDAQAMLEWHRLLDNSFRPNTENNSARYTWEIVGDGESAMNCYAKRDADVIKSRSFLVDWEGLKFLALNTARCNSNTFAARDIPATGHDALMAFYFNGKRWSTSLYHAAHRKDLDLSLIAVKHGGGGHRGACGFTSATSPIIG